MKKITIAICFFATLFCFNSGAQAGWNGFADDVNYSTGNYPRGITAADFDGQNGVDLATSNEWGNNISVLLNNGDGTFQAAANYPAGNNAPYSIDNGFLNNDGYPDLVTINLYDGKVYVLMNNGDGTFANPAIYTVGGNPNEVRIGDLNGDYHPDLVVTRWNGDYVTLLFNNGNGNFQNITDLTAGDGPEGSYIADYDNDGDNDLAVANYQSDNVSIMFNNGNGTFGSPNNYAAGDGPISLYAADVDGDGDLDLAVSKGYDDKDGDGKDGDNNVSILFNNGDGTFQSPVNYTTADWPSSIDGSDFDGRNGIDLVVANRADRNFSMMPNNGDGSFGAPINFSTGSGPSSICAADFNGDNIPDVATANRNAHNISVFINQGYVWKYPLITDIVRVPVQPKPNQDCEISATITDTSSTSSIVTAELYYDNGSGYISVGMGNSADSFFATIPDQPAGTTVDYYIYAEDDDGENVTSDTLSYTVEFYTIYEVQFQADPGGGHDCYPSDFDETAVTLKGVVTAVRQGTDHWFWMQDPADTLWNGLYVYDTTVDPTVGDSLTITGTIGEYYGVTEMMDVTESTINSSGNPLDTTYVTTATIDSLCAFTAEQYEGMLVELRDVSVVEGPSGFNECWVEDASGVPCIIDDELWKYGTNQPDPQPAVGMQYERIVGVVHYSYDAYRIYPRGAEDYHLIISEPCCDVEMDPDNPPVTVPAGGSFGVTGILGNPTDDPITTDVWWGVVAFNNYYEQGLIQDIPLNSGQYIQAHLQQDVPSFAPAGQYIYAAWCGERSSWDACDSFGFQFTVTTALASGGAEEWLCHGGFGIEEDYNIPTETALLSNYPNPFNATTVIPFDLSTDGNVSLKVYNLAGQLVETLVNGYMNAGSHEINWDASTVSSGVYFYTLETDDFATTKKMNLLK